MKSGTIRMTVQRDVIRYLSIGLYQNFGRAIKELVSNAYDAGATEVKIRLDFLNDRIIVRDNGVGMDVNELEQKFLKIGFPTEPTDDVNIMGRKRIGAFGIGSVAIFPYCEKVIVLTKKKGNNENVELDIDVSKFFKGGSFVLSEGEHASFPYKVTPSDLPIDIGETIIVLEGIKPYIANELRTDKKPKGTSVEKLSGYEKFKWTLAQYCPLQFPEEQKELREFFEVKDRIPLRLWLDGKEFFRNVPAQATIIDKGAESFGNVKVKYVIMCPFKTPVRPEEAKGLQVRLKDVGVGFPRDFDLIKYTGKIPGKLNYLCGEVHILEGLSDALMIDRDSFSYVEEVSRLEDYFRKKLAKWNGYLEDKSLHDKEIYEGVQFTDGSEEVLNELQKANLIQFPKERLRISKGSIAKSKRRAQKPASPASRIKDLLKQDHDFKVESTSATVTQGTAPIEVNTVKKTVMIYEKHPAFLEKIRIFNKEFTVDYSNWDSHETPAICKLDGNKVIYNLSHPLFRSGLSDRAVKELSLGLLLIFRDEPDGFKFLKPTEKLLLEVFAQRD